MRCKVQKPTMDDLLRACPYARRLAKPHLATLRDALARGWLLIPAGRSLAIRKHLSFAWWQWFGFQQTPLIQAVTMPVRSHVDYELPDGTRLSDAGLAELRHVVRGANRSTSATGTRAGFIQCHTPDTELLGQTVWDIIGEHLQDERGVRQ